MPELSELLACEDGAVEENLMSKSRPQLQSLVTEIWRADFCSSSLIALETILSVLTMHEELLEVCEFVIDFLWRINLPEEYRESTTVFLTECILKMEEWKLERLAHHIIQLLKEECTEKVLVFDALACAVDRLERSENIAESITERLCAVTWNLQNLLSILDAFASTTFKLPVRTAILRKCLSSLSDLPPGMVSPMICKVFQYNEPDLLGMSFAHLTKYFAEQQNTPHGRDAVLTILEESIPQVYHLLKNKSPATIPRVVRSFQHLPALLSLEPFALALLASLLGGWENWQQVSKHLCSAVSYAFTSTDRIIGSAAHRRVCSCTCEPRYCIDRVLELCLPTSWNVVLLGLARLCFSLIDFASPSGRIGASADLHRRQGAACLTRRPPSMMPSRRAVTAYATHHFGTVSRAKHNARICRLAVKTLTDMFQAYPSVRRDLISYALSKLWSDPRSPSCFQITELLAELAALCPHELTGSAASELESLLDGLAILPLELASAILQAFLPLFTAAAHPSSVDDRPLDAFLGLQARVVAELRSMSTSFRVRVRRIAVAGFVKLLKNLKVKASNFQSASQNSWPSQSQMSSTQSWLSMAPCAFPLFTQINNTQVIHSAVVLPSDPARNEALCTEIVGLLQRLVSSTLLTSSPATQRDDPEALVKSDIYWGLCEVAMFNPGLVSPVITLLWRLLSKCLDPALSRTKPTFNSESGSTSLPDAVRAVPLRLSQLITLTEPDSVLVYREHPEVLAWCLQIILALPSHRPLWPRFCRGLAGEADQASGTSGLSQSLTQSSSVSNACGVTVSNRLFSRVAHLLFNLSAALRETPLDEFGLMPEIELGSSPVGRLNQARLKMLLGLYDACLEFEARNPLSSIARPGASWAQLKRLFSRREAARRLLLDRTGPSSSGAATAEPATAAAAATDTAKDFNETGAVESLSHPLGNTNILIGQNICFIGMSEDAARGGQLRGALLLSSLRSAVAGLHQALKSAPRGGGFAPHLLQTIAARLVELLPAVAGRSSAASQPVLTATYREAFVTVIGRTARLLIRFYVAVIAQEVAGAEPGVLGPVASAAISLLSLCFTVVTDALGTARLHRVAVTLYPVVVTPKPLRLLTPPRQSADDALLVEDSVEFPDSEEEEDQGASYMGLPDSESSPACSPSQALTALVKLIKSWVTRILTSISSAESADAKSAAANDLTTLLPLLISLCEARSAIVRPPNGDDVSPAKAAAVSVPDFTGLDRVLLWLVRLLTRRAPQLGPNAAPLHAQLTRLTLQLAHLLGSANAGSSKRTSTQSTRDSSSVAPEDLDCLTWDDLIVLLATDLHTVLGDLEQSDISQTAERRLNFSVVSKSSANSIFSIVLSALFEAYEDFSWLVDYLSQEVNHSLAITGAFAQIRRPVYKFSELPDAMQAREEVVCNGLITIAESLDELLQTNVSAPSHIANELARLVTCVYNLLGNVVKHYLTLIQRNLGTFPRSFERVVRVYGRQVMPHAYAFVYYLQMCESEKARHIMEAQSLKKAKPGATASKSKIRKLPSKRTVNRVPKDLKLLPQLIGTLEQYESSLCRLSKKTKVRFAEGVLPGLSRDFRVNRDAVLTALEEINEGDSSLDSLPEVNAEEGLNVVAATAPAPATAISSSSAGRPSSSAPQPDDCEDVRENGDGSSSVPKACPPSKRPCLRGRSNIRRTGVLRSQNR
ncbi:hypothetical protein SprV_0100485600 [Sparganum proliferum]